MPGKKQKPLLKAISYPDTKTSTGAWARGSNSHFEHMLGVLRWASIDRKCVHLGIYGPPFRNVHLVGCLDLPILDEIFNQRLEGLGLMARALLCRTYLSMKCHKGRAWRRDHTFCPHLSGQSIVWRTSMSPCCLVLGLRTGTSQSMPLDWFRGGAINGDGLTTASGSSI